MSVSEAGYADQRAKRRARVMVASLWVAFAVTRLLPLALTFDPSLYGDISDPTGDVERYADWANQIVGEGLAPYREVDIEYPPGSLPFVIVPALLGPARFSPAIFVALMVVLDVVAFAVLLMLARRAGEGERQRAGGRGSAGEGERQRAGGRGHRGSYRGVIVWLLLPPLLGVVLYARLDLIPAVALLLALERAHARGWLTSGVWLGLGTAAKLVPGLFIPLALVAARGRRVRLLVGAVVGGLVAWLPFAGDTAELIGDVFGYHSARGIHLESIWGSVLNLERVSGGPAELVFAFGAFHIAGPGDETMLRWTTALSVAIVVVSLAVAVVRWRRRPQRARRELPLAVTATLALLLGTGRVFSPQFVIWLLAAAAVLFAVRPRIALWAGPLLAVIVVLTAVGYPLGFDLLRDGARWPALVLLWRNIAVIVLGLMLLVSWLIGDRAAPADGEEDPRPQREVVKYFTRPA
jgi:hypothetical protein